MFFFTLSSCTALHCLQMDTAIQAWVDHHHALLMSARQSCKAICVARGVSKYPAYQHVVACKRLFDSTRQIFWAVQSTYGISSMARSAVLISRHAKAAAAHQAAQEEDTSA